MGEFRILEGDALSVLKTLPADSVHCCVTSPPYWGLRDYGTGKWEGGDAACPHRRSNVHPEHHNRTITGRGSQSSTTSSAAPYKETCGLCGAVRVDQQLGLEPTPAEYIARIVEIFREVRRVLRRDGTLWLNLGDCYCSDAGYADAGVNEKDIAVGSRPEYAERRFRVGPDKDPKRGRSAEGQPIEAIRSTSGLKHKDLVGMPWRVALALQEDGWWLRSDIIWSKPNPMPESVTDRPTKAHEYIFLLSKSPRYYYDREAILEPLATNERENYPERAKVLGRGQQSFNGLAAREGDRDKSGGFPPSYRGSSFTRGKTAATKPDAGQGPRNEYAGRNKRSVWTVATQPLPEAHFATFPPTLIEPCILAGTSEKGCCPDCGTPWQRVVIRRQMQIEASDRGKALGVFGRTAASGTMIDPARSTSIGWRPTCDCYDDLYRAMTEPRRSRKREQRAAWPGRWNRLKRRPGGNGWRVSPAIVLDTFNGSGASGLVALGLGRSYVGVELNPEYIEMARRRITKAAPLLNMEASA